MSTAKATVIENINHISDSELDSHFAQKKADYVAVRFRVYNQAGSFLVGSGMLNCSLIYNRL